MFRLALIATVIVSSQTYAQSKFEYEPKIDELVVPWIEADKVMAVSVGVIYDGKKAWAGHYGVLSPGGPKPTNKTIYEIGSISKVFTSVLLADAVVQGKVSLDDTLDSLIPSLKEKNPEVGSSITLRHLSHHMSGLPRMPSNMRPRDSLNPFDGYDRKRLDGFLAKFKPAREPDALHEYSNLGAGLLGDLLARQANTDYETLLKSRIAKPLKMSSTSQSVPKSSMGLFAPPYNAALMEDRRWDFQALAGAGSIRSSIVDMMRFMKANLNPQDDDISKALNLAYEKQLDGIPGKRHAMGLGWMLADDQMTRWHNGQTGGYQSMMLVSRELKLGVVLLCNAAGSGADQLGEQIFRLCAGSDEKPRVFADRKVDSKTVDRLAGKYQLGSGMLTIKTKNGSMMAQLTGQTFLSLHPVSETEWKYDLVEATLKFELPESGKSPKVTLFQNGNEMPFERVGD